VPPAPVGRTAEHRCRCPGQVRGPPADAEDEDERSRPRQVRDQAFQLVSGSLIPAILLIPRSLPRVGDVSGWEHGATRDRYPTVRQMTSLEGVGRTAVRTADLETLLLLSSVVDRPSPWLMAR
jgi:hypothetical protein